MTRRRRIVLLLVLVLLIWTYHNRSLLMRPKVAMAIAVVELTGNSEFAWEHWGAATAISLKYLFNNIDPFKDRDICLSMLHSHSYHIRATALNIITEHLSGKVASDDPLYVTIVDLAQNDSNDKVRSIAIYALGMFQNEDVCDVLIRMYTSDNGSFSGDLAGSLKSLNCPNVAELLKPRAPREVSVLMKIVEAAYPGGIRKDYTHEQQNAEDELASVAETQFDEFLPYLESPNPGIRRLTMSFLSGTKKRDAFEPIVKVLHTDPIMEVRYSAVINLGILGDKRACPILAQVLKQKSFGVTLPDNPYSIDVYGIHNQTSMIMSELHCFSENSKHVKK